MLSNEYFVAFSAKNSVALNLFDFLLNKYGVLSSLLDQQSEFFVFAVIYDVFDYVLFG